MQEIKLKALGVREVDFGDYDRYLTALTYDGRRIEIFCKGARRNKRQNPAARQLCWSEFILTSRGGKYYYREADLVHSFFGLSGDIEKYALACYFLELASAVTDAEIENAVVCPLLLMALYSLEKGKRDPELIKAVFEWRIMKEAGYAPELNVCGICGDRIEKLPLYFSVRNGSAAHEKCASRIGGWEFMPNSALKAVGYVENAEPLKAYSFKLEGKSKQVFCKFAESYVQYHLERGFESLKFYKSVAIKH